MSIEVGNVVEGVVTGITNFGAFVELPEGKNGLVHISEVADVYVRDVRDFLSEQDKVKVKVVSIDDRGKIGLSIKQLQEAKPVAEGEAESSSLQGAPASSRAPRGNVHNNRGYRTSASFEDKLSKYLKDSDERLSDLRRKTDSKRGGRGSRRA